MFGEPDETTVAATVIDVRGKTVYTNDVLYSGEPIDVPALGMAFTLFAFRLRQELP
jgi:hypothetical protein